MVRLNQSCYGALHTASATMLFFQRQPKEDADQLPCQPSWPLDQLCYPSLPLPPFQHPLIPRKRAAKGVRGRNPKRLSQFTLNLSEPIQEALILLAGLPAHTLHPILQGADSRECRQCLPLFSLSCKGHSDPHRANIRVQHFEALFHSCCWLTFALSQCRGNKWHLWSLLKNRSHSLLEVVL